MKKVIIVGGGASGAVAAVFAARSGAQVTLIEKNEKIGKKLFITGKGRCNFTNVCDNNELLTNVVSNPKFLYSAFNDFSSADAVAFFEELGVKTKTERGRRAFPASDHASDIIRALERELKRLGVDVRLNCTVKEILFDNDAAVGVVAAQKNISHDEKIFADAVIVCTGGLSYPSTGSTGDGYCFAQNAGMRVTDTRPALVPIEAEDDFIPQLQGLSLKNVSLTIKKDKKILYDGFGEMLFTHNGISGPLALSASSYIGKILEKQKLRAYIDLKPALSSEQLDARILREFSENKNKLFKNAVTPLFPSSLTPVIVERSDIKADTPVNSVGKGQRHEFVRLIKNFSLTLVALGAYTEAVITQGGIGVRDIDPSTMESKKIRGLYFAGEVMDVDALTGGYNLQIAWSTAHKAGTSAAFGG